MRIGNIALESNLCLSPLAGYTNLPFRLTVREIGGLGFVTTDLVNARSLIERSRVALQLSATCAEDQPMSIQLFGGKPEEMRDAAIAVQEMGASAVDVNMGCPAPNVCRVGGGAAMMTEAAVTAALVRGMVDAVRIPVTAKMRLGWDDANITAPELARALEEAGVAAIFVHGRTRAQGFSGRVRLDGIRAVVEAARRVPIIGNGDVTTPEAARVMLERTGCAGVSIGRGAFYNPWIFARTRHYLATGEMLPDPSFEECFEVMYRHLERMVAFFGESRGCRLFRKVAKRYSRRFGPAGFFNREMTKLSARDQFGEIAAAYRKWRERFLDADGELLPQYRPRPPPSSFMEEDMGERAGAIRLPEGPVDVW